MSDPSGFSKGRILRTGTGPYGDVRSLPIECSVTLPEDDIPPNGFNPGDGEGFSPVRSYNLLFPSVLIFSLLAYTIIIDLVL
jgi:hypothetical protein